MLPPILFLSVLGLALACPVPPGLVVKTSTGIITGMVNETVPGVRQFLSIPYALPPTGERRFMPPEPLSPSPSRDVDATQWPPSCPQYGSRLPSVYTEYMGQNFIRRINQGLASGAVVDSSTEDCLFLAIFAPEKIEKKVPVIFFVSGGGFQSGGIDIDMQKPHRWVQRTQSHIVVTINYRVNIFGFAGSSAVEQKNAGVLDARLAVEWVHKNIAAFGGDPDRIILWGSSAGSRLVEFYSYLYLEEPLVQGYYLDSGSAMSNSSVPILLDDAASQFSFVASNVGCGDLEDAHAELRCMQQVPWESISDFVGKYQDNSTDIAPNQRAIAFRPIDDGKTVFSNYTAVIESGRYTKLPIIQSSCANEGASQIAGGLNWPLRGGYWPNQTTVSANTLQNFMCPKSRLSAIRASLKVPHYRWQFAAITKTVALLPWLGAYHGSDLPYLFGSFQDYPGRAPPSQLAFDVSHAMQDHLLAFAEDPVDGLDNIGFPDYSTGKMLRFGGRNGLVEVIDALELDSVCAENKPWAYDPFP